MLTEDGHLTDTPLSIAHSGVASFKGDTLVMFLTELNGIESQGVGMGNSLLRRKD